MGFGTRPGMWRVPREFQSPFDLVNKPNVSRYETTVFLHLLNFLLIYFTEELLAYIDCITSKIDSLSPTSTAALGLLQLLSSLCSGDFANKLQKKKTFVEICMNVLTKAMKLEGKRSQDIEDGNAQSGLLCANLLEVLASFVRVRVIQYFKLL